MIVEQYHIYLPTINIYWNQVKSGAQSIGSQALDHGTKVTSGVQEIVINTYDKISPQVRKFFIRAFFVTFMLFYMPLISYFWNENLLKSCTKLLRSESLNS